MQEIHVKRTETRQVISLILAILPQNGITRYRLHLDQAKNRLIRRPGWSHIQMTIPVQQKVKMKKRPRA